MSFLRLLLTVLAMAAGSSLCASPDDPKPTSTAPAQSPPVVEHAELDAGSLTGDDPDYQRHVDLSTLGAALAGRDASAATDVALQLIEGERVLGRPHHAISADEATRLALRLAAKAGDKDSLKRLATLADRSNDADLLARVRAAEKLTAPSRALAESVAIPNGLTPDRRDSHEAAIRRADLAESLADAQVLGELAGVLEADQSLEAEFRKSLSTKLRGRQATDGADSFPLGLLYKLEAETRNGSSRVGQKERRAGFSLSCKGVDNKKDEDRKECQIRDGWQIVNVVPQETSKYGNAGHSFGYLEKNGYFASQGDFSSFDAAMKAAGQAGPNGLTGQIESELNYIREMHRKYVNTSHAVVYGTAYARGRGKFQPGSSVNVTYYVDEVYVGSSQYVRDRGQYWLNAARRQGGFNYTLKNDSGRPVTFRLPSGKDYTLAVGQSGSYKFTGDSSQARVYVYDTKRTYRLKAGNHRFWWMADKKQIGLDLQGS